MALSSVLTQNQLVGSIPDMFANMQALIEVSLDSNSFSGSIPPSLYLLAHLQILNLYNNGFTGSLSSSLGTWRELTHLYA